MGAGASTYAQLPEKGGAAVDASGVVEKALDDPAALAEVVKSSWSGIAEVRPPMPEGANPTDLPYAIPVTFPEMFGFNSMVMNNGTLSFSQSTSDPVDMNWASDQDLMTLFCSLPKCIDDPGKFHESCTSFITTPGVSAASAPQLDLFKAIMFATLRSLLPRQWTLQHEMAWSWFWERVDAERRAPASPDLGASVTSASESLLRGSKDIIIQGKPLVELVQQSYGIVPKEQPPCPEGDDPLKQVPITFIKMATFNLMIITTPQWWSGTTIITEDMGWVVPLALPAMENLVETFGTDEFQTQCESLGVAIKEKGATEEAIKDMAILILCSMRSLLPFRWSTQHEVAWRNFWESAAYHMCTRM